MEKPCLRILLIDDEEIIHETLGGYLSESGALVKSLYDGLCAIEEIERTDYDLMLVDLRMPGMDGFSLLEKVQQMRPEMSVVIITGHGNMETAIQALRMGAADFLPKPIKLLELDAVVEKALRIRDLRRDKRHLRETIGGLQKSEGIREGNRALIGVSRATDDLREQIARAVEAGCDSILIEGETGTGKEVVAREIHFQASSEDSPFIAVSCPALPDSLVESELFGHTKGAFTGATGDRAGYFELADGGTLFLDEVGDLSESAQAKLLRVLETRSFRRVSGAKEIEVNVRVIAATNKPLQDLVRQRFFRSDLMYRLNVFSLFPLPLRQRRDDVIPIAEHFLQSYRASRGLPPVTLGSAAKELLLAYDCPGNARELRNIVERAAILGAGGRAGCEIAPEHLSLPRLDKTDGIGAFGVSQRISAESDDRDGERRSIVVALEQSRWNRKRAATMLGMPYSTLRYKIEKLGIG